MAIYIYYSKTCNGGTPVGMSNCINFCVNQLLYFNIEMYRLQQGDTSIFECTLITGFTVPSWQGDQYNQIMISWNRRNSNDN